MDQTLWKDAYSVFCERYKASIQARHYPEVSDSVLFSGLAQRLGRLSTPSVASSHPVKRKSSETHLCSTVIQGTPLLAPQVRELHLLRLPKLPTSDIRLQQFLKRKKLVTGLTPRVARKAATELIGTEDLEQAGPLSSTMKEFQARPQDPVLDFIQKVNRRVQNLRRPRASCSQSPELSIDEEKPTAKASLDFQSAPDGADRPQTIESHRAVLLLPEDLDSSGILMARRMKIAVQTRSCTNSMPAEPPPAAPKPVLKRRHYKPPELKAVPDSLPLFYSALSVEMQQFLLKSNGMTPTSADFPYKFYVGPGNNGQLVAATIKKRWFWTRVDSWQQADFIWTQNKQSAIVERLAKTQELPQILSPEGEGQTMRFTGRKKALSGVEIERKKAGIELISASESYVGIGRNPDQTPTRLYNRIERNYQLTSKKRLFLNLQAYFLSRGEDVFSAVPQTFLIQQGRDDPEFRRFEGVWREQRGLWIVKPGELTNCGHGIHVSADLEEIRALVASTTDGKGRKRTHIVQKYLEKPLLVHKRKFDIRCYGLLTCFNGHIQGYFYHDGYLRTSSKEFSLKTPSNRYIHLTNDAVQKKSDDYGKFESGNKLSYPDFQKYLQTAYPSTVDFWTHIWPQIRRLMTETFRAAAHHLDPHRRRHTFEVLGYDFMVDEQFKVWLIEVNTNPCLALSAPYLARLIPAMLDNALRVAVDPYFPEPASKKHQGEWNSQLFENKIEAVFSSLKDAYLSADEQISVASSEAEASEADEAN